MATTEDALTSYTHLPLQYDPKTSTLTTTTSSLDTKLNELLNNISSLSQSLKTLENDATTPPPPLPILPKRSAQLTKMRESAAAEVKKGPKSFPSALQRLDLAIRMASDRPSWEPVGLAREEMALTYMERANLHVMMQNWPDGYVDSLCSLECKKGRQQVQGPNGQVGITPGNPRAAVLAGKCLVEMARYQEAGDLLSTSLEIEGDTGSDADEMKRLLGICEERLGIGQEG